MSRRIWSLVAVCVVLALLAVLGGGMGTAHLEAGSGASVQWAGYATRNPASGFFLVRDDAAWRALWTAHAGAPKEDFPLARHAAPIVDFERCIVVAYFRGPGTNRDGEILQSVVDKDGVVRLRFEGSTFQTSGNDGRGGAVDTRSFGIWVIGATDKPIVIEEGVKSLKDEPIRWRRVKRFDGR